MQMNQATVEALFAMLAPMVKQAKGRKTRSDKGFTAKAVADAQTTDERKAAFAAATVKAFEKAGYKDVQPKVNVLVYGRPAKDDKPATGWVAQGRKVKTGEKAVYVKAPGMYGKGMPLFHLLQTEPVATEENTAPQS